MLTNRLQKFIGLSAALCLGFTLNAQADAVSDWNMIAVQTIGAAAPSGRIVTSRYRHRPFSCA
jgi:hypothetical protein